MSRVCACALTAAIFLASLSASAVGQEYGSLNLIDEMLLAASQEEPAARGPAPVITAQEAMMSPRWDSAREQLPGPIIDARPIMASEAVPTAVAPTNVPAHGINDGGFDPLGLVPSMLRQASHAEPTPAPGQPLPAPASSVRRTYAEESVPAGDTPAQTESTIVMEDGSYLWTDLGGFCCNCCSCGLYGGLEGTFLAPINEPTRMVSLTNLKTNEVYEGTAEPGLGAGVRAWAGIHNCGCGFRVQFWHFGSHYIHPEPVVPNKPPAFNESYYLDANTLDIELTRGFCCGHWKIDASLGGRYASLKRNATVVGFGTAGGVDLYGMAMGSHELEGTGFTFSIGTRTPVHFLCGLNFYFNYRGSLVWADAATSVFTEANAVSSDPMGAANSRDRAFAGSDNDERLFISEFQVGLQYERCLPCCGAKMFLRAGMEYQHWDTGDLAATSGSYAYLQGGPPAIGGRVDAAADAHQGTLDLIGFVLGAGITY